MHFVYVYLNYFPKNLRASSIAKGERFYYDNKTSEKLCQGGLNTNIMADYRCFLKTKVVGGSYARRAKKTEFGS